MFSRRCWIVGLELITSFPVVSSVKQVTKLDVYFTANFSLFDSLIDASRKQQTVEPSCCTCLMY